MRKLLLKIANKIYKKYGFQEIRKGQTCIFKNDIYIIQEITLEQQPLCLDVLKVTLHQCQSLQSYLSDKIRRGD